VASKAPLFCLKDATNLSSYRFIFWPGAGNQPPAVGIAQELATARENARALEAVCTGPSYIQAARRVPKLISAHSGATTTAFLVEALSNLLREA
jgi:hypothetical protein